MNYFLYYFAKELENGDGPVVVNFEFRACIMNGDNPRGFQTGWKIELFKGLVS